MNTRPKTECSDFTFRFAGSGHYEVTYTSPVTYHMWRYTLTDMTLMDEIRSSENVKRTTLDHLKRLVKNYGQRIM